MLERCKVGPEGHYMRHVENILFELAPNPDAGVSCACLEVGFNTSSNGSRERPPAELK